MLFSKSIKSLFFSGKIVLINVQKCSLRTNCSIKEVTIPEAVFQQKLLKVAVIGMPNAGKSTFINYLMDRKVCPVSTKVHTTRRKASAILTVGESQIIFLDTPGLVTDRERKKFNLEDSFVSDCRNSLKQADIIGVIHDVSNFYLRDKLDIKIIKLLGKHLGKQSILILNKVDALKSKRKLLDITRIITENCIDGKPTGVHDDLMLKYMEHMSEGTEDKKGWPYFSEVFMTSALTGSGLQEIKDYFVKQAKPEKWSYPENIFTDQKAEDIIIASVKARLLDFLQQEIPYMLEPYIEYFDVNEEGAINTVILVKCPTERLSKLIAGTANGRLRQIIEKVQMDLQNVFQTFVRVNIVLEVPKNQTNK